MKILLAFDSYKGCLSAADLCQTAAQAIRARWTEAEVLQLPLSDGGEGMVECVALLCPVQLVSVRAHGPLMEPLEATYALSPDGQTAFMEMAATSGLTLVPELLRNPCRTTTYGVGEMLFDAWQRGVRHIVMGIGGSATCDAGRGMLDSLNELHFPLFGANANGTSIPRITVACDVTNPLCGPQGAAYVFGPQKGATPEQLQVLEARLRDEVFRAEKAGVIEAAKLAERPGAGAAGGLGFALMAYLGAELRSGIDILLDIVGFEEKLQGVDLVITGEGCSDRQTLMGKVPYGVLQRAMRQEVPVHLLSGGIRDADDLLAAGFASVRSINEGDNRPLSFLMQPDVARENLTHALNSPLLPK